MTCSRPGLTLALEHKKSRGSLRGSSGGARTEDQKLLADALASPSLGSDKERTGMNRSRGTSSNSEAVASTARGWRSEGSNVLIGAARDARSRDGLRRCFPARRAVPTSAMQTRPMMAPNPMRIAIVVFTPAVPLIYWMLRLRPTDSISVKRRLRRLCYRLKKEATDRPKSRTKRGWGALSGLTGQSNR